MNNPQIPVGPWKQVSSDIALDVSWFRVRKETVELPSGEVVPDYYVWDSPDIATIVPVTKDGRFVLCRQYRHAVKEIMLQFPAGAVNRGETAAEAAAREMKEETGYVAKSVTPLSKVAVYPTKLSGWHHLFLAADAVQEGEPANDGNEPTEVILKTRDELENMIERNEVRVADSLVAALLSLRRL